MPAKPKAKAKRVPGAKRDIKKPGDFSHCFDGQAFCFEPSSGRHAALIEARLTDGTAGEARRLAAWLLRAADWSDAQAARRKG